MDVAIRKNYFSEFPEARRLKLTEFVCNLKLCHYNVEQAAERCGITKETARKWYKTALIQETLKAEQEYVLEKYDITLESIEQELATIAYEDNDKLIAHKALQNKVKALELLGVQRGMFVKGVDINLEVNLGARLRDALERRKQRISKKQEIIPITVSTIQDVVLPTDNNQPEIPLKVANQEEPTS